MPQLPVITNNRNLKGKRVFVRASLDVPLQGGEVLNYFRILRAMPTLKHLIHEGAKIILTTHLGRNPETTVVPVFDVLQKHMNVTYVPALTGQQVKEAIKHLNDGDVLLLENLRSVSGEVKNDPDFSKELASYADVYVNDAFAVSHRDHASIVGVPRYIPGCFGLTFYEEYLNLLKVLNPHHPSFFILGGAKFETKQPLVEKYIETYDHVFVGGALANDFFKAKGYEVGDSLVSDTELRVSNLLTKENLLLPIDVVVDGADGVRITSPDKVKEGEKILDGGPETVKLLRRYIEPAKTILWNGPIGNYEGGFGEATRECAKLISESDAYSVVGGGDTIAAIESLHLDKKFSFLSTAGGAMLYFLEKGTLPGIEAIVETYDPAP